VKHLLDIQKSVGGYMKLFEADLNNETSFIDPIKGCDYVMHTASPYSLSVKNPQTDLVDPAINGTLAVMKACAKEPSVKRVILTSSMAAITDSPKGLLTEQVWNTKSSLKRNPYYFSKVEAERAAWTFVATNNPKLDLVVINPFMVMGPSFSPQLGESASALRSVIDGSYPAILALDWGYVDVRDVAKAHILAMEKPNANGRYVTFDHKISMKELCTFLKENYPQFKGVPSSSLECGPGNALMKLAANFQSSGVKDYLKSNLGKELKFDNSKIKTDLGMAFLPLDQTIKDTIEDMIKWGHINDPCAH